MSTRLRTRTGVLVLLSLLATIAPALDAPAAPASAEPSTRDAPRLWSRVQALRTAVAQWLSPFGVVFAADGEDPPPDPEEEEDDPFGGDADGDPGSGSGVSDPNGGGES